VCRTLYRAQKYSEDELTGDYTLTERQMLAIDRVYEVYGQKTPDELSELTHREDPWRNARGNAQPNERTRTAISTDAIQTYFRSLQRSAREWQRSDSLESAAARVVDRRADLLSRLA